MTDGANGADREAGFRAYLLGQLPPERQEEIDERFLADPELHAELQATADDLIHAYLDGELSAADREQFEAHFLASPRRRERVAFMRSLLTAVDRMKTPAASPRPWRLAPTLPWAAVLVMGLAAGGWSIAEKRRGELERADARRREDSLRQQILTQEQRVRELESRAGATESTDITTWILGPGVERGAAASEGFTARGEWIRLRVPLEHDLNVASYRVSLQTSDGREVLRMGGLRESPPAGGRTVDVMVPAGLLRPGGYLLSVQRDARGAPEELTAVTFVVR